MEQQQYSNIILQYNIIILALNYIIHADTLPYNKVSEIIYVFVCA